MPASLVGDARRQGTGGQQLLGTSREAQRRERREVDPDRAQDLIDLAEGLKMYPQFGRAVHYLRGLAGAEHRPRYVAKPLEFISRGGGNGSSFIVCKPGPRPVPAMSTAKKRCVLMCLF